MNRARGHADDFTFVDYIAAPTLNRCKITGKLRPVHTFLEQIRQMAVPARTKAARATGTPPSGLLQLACNLQVNKAMNKPDKTFEDLRRKARESAATRWSRKELAQIALLKGAHQESIAPIIRDCPVKVLASGDVLLRAGEPCEALYMVLSGRLHMEDLSGTAIRAGDSIGELFLLEQTVSAMTISAVEPTRLLVINRDVAWALIKKSHEIARNWLALFAERTQVSGTIAGSEEFKTTHADQAAQDEHAAVHHRSWLNSMLPRLVARGNTSKKPLGLLLFEIDGFADYVARFGHAAGERAHHAVAQTIIMNVRPTDLVVNHGAAQFAVVLPDSDATHACLVGERVRKAISLAGALAPDQSVLHSLTVSAGATELKPSFDASILLAAAETALLMAKTRGGDRVAMQ